MDVAQLLDLTERLLILYGYEVERDIGLPGKGIATADLTRETKEGKAPTEERGELMYRADIFAEKKDIERPFGRIVVLYNKTQGPAQPQQVSHLAKLMEAANAYMGIFVTATGFTDAAATHAGNYNIRIFTQDDVERLIGKAMATKPWWQSINAYPTFFGYEDSLLKTKHEMGAWFHRSWEIAKIGWAEYSYLPYWLFSYHILEKPVQEGDKYKIPHGAGDLNMMAINAHTGMIDTWIDFDPIKLQRLEGTKKVTYKGARRGLAGGEMYVELLWEPHGTPGPVTKPKDLPEGVRFEVYKPVLEKWEAKVSATQWMAYLWNTDPKNVLITDIQLVYFPWWRFRVDMMPYIKNPWGEVEWITSMVSGQILDVFNMWQLTEYRKNIVFLMAEKYMVKLLGPKRYIKVMNFITYKLINRLLYWDLGIKPSHNWIMLLFFALFLSMVYGMLVFKTGIMLLVFIALLFIFIGPGYALLYVIMDYLKHYPWGKPGEGRRYSHPAMHARGAVQVSKKETEGVEAMRALKQLEEMYSSDELSQAQRKRLEAYWKKQADKKAREARKAA